MNQEIPNVDNIKKSKKTIIPQWLKRELAVFFGMILESFKFIIVSVLVFASVYAIINGPALWSNVRWWWYVNYVEDHSGSWWGEGFPVLDDTAEPNNTLFIPKIGVQAPIKFAKTKTNSEINQLLLEGVVHYPSANPGEIGNVFITGHSSYYWWSKGQYNNVFSILDKLVVGDNIYINYNRKRYNYKVRELKVVSPSDTSVLEQNEKKSILTLMTCTPVGTNYKRLIVVSDLEK